MTPLSRAKSNARAFFQLATRRLAIHSAQFLKISLSNQSLDITLSNIELAVLCQSDGPK